MIRKVTAMFVMFLIVFMPFSFALSISNVTVEPEHDSAMVSWNTDDIASGTVNYGLTKGLGQSSSHAGLGTLHEVNLIALESGRTYYYEVVSTNNSGSTKKDNNFMKYHTFETKDKDAPARVKGVSQKESTTNSITLEWTANTEPDIKQYVIYRDGVNVANSGTNSFTDTGLDQDTSYLYKVAAMDTSDNEGFASLAFEARTIAPDTSGPVITDLGVSDPTETSMKVNWKTDENSDSKVVYGLNMNFELTANKSESIKTHSLELTGLLNDTVYYYKVVSCDSSANCRESDAASFKTGVDNTAPFIQVEVGEWHNRDKIDLIGSTEPFARILVYVNDELKRALNTGESGEFSFSGVDLDVTKTNQLRFVSIDQVGFETFIDKEVKIDTVVPRVNVTKFGRFTNTTTFVLKGNVSEQVKLTIDVIEGEKTRDFPEKVENLRLVNTEGNSAELTWDVVERDDIDGYLIYRDGKLLTKYDDNTFVDPALNRSSTHVYTVSAITTACLEGEKSESLTVIADDNISVLDDSFEELVDYCDIGKKSRYELNVNGGFSQQIELNDGPNLVIVNATDIAGNSVVIEQETIVDTEVPVIESTNLGDLTPSYSKHVKVTGRVSEREGQNIIVEIDVDGKKYSGLADENGRFEIGIELSRDVRDDINADTDYDPEERKTNYLVDNSPTWTNHVKIVARTESGLESEPVEGDIKLAICGHGTWFRVDLGEATPSMLTPRLMLEGIAQIGIPVDKIEWRGGRDNATILNVKVDLRDDISDEDKSDYDLDLVNSRISYSPSTDKTKGYALVKVKKLDTGNILNEIRKEQGDDGKEGVDADELTTLEMENLLSDHRIGDCIVGGFGCIRIPLIMEIDFDTKNDNYYYGNDEKEVERHTQKQCWDVEIAIDRRIPTDKIPEKFLKSSIKLIEDLEKAIDAILEPLTTIKKILFYSCAGSWIIDFVLAFQESYHCEFSSTLNIFTDGDKQWDPYIAKTGQCEDADLDSDQMEACMSCQDAVESRKEFQSLSKYTCDRIFCPSAPTFQKYIRDSSEGKISAAEAKKAQEESSDCAFGKETFRSMMQYKGMNKLYEDYRDMDEEDKDYCEGLHEPDNNCCVYEYLGEWDSACLIMDEALESKCVAREEDPKLPEDPDCTSGRKLWNSFAGFCEPDGTSSVEPINVQDIFDDTPVNYNQRKYEVGITSNKNVWVRIIPKDYATKVFGSDAESNIHYAEIGRITENIKASTDKYEVGEPTKVSATRVFEPIKNVYLPIDVSTDDYNSKEWMDGYKRFEVEYKKAINTRKDKGKIVERIYKDLQNRIGISGKEYIVDPTSSIARSLQCVCIPGITSYLGLWKLILGVLRNCFQTILVTGDGSAGICREGISVYVCDLVYDLISCFTQKYGQGFQRESSNSGFGNIFASLTKAGNSINENIMNRYGDSSLFNQIFSEKKLLHSACLWAFTGTWDVDINPLLEEDINIDVKSTVVAYPCTRRFVSYNPASDPSGLTTYVYDVTGVIVAGSEVTYKAELVCSDDNSCDTPDGACDCTQIGEQRRSVVLGPGTVSRGDVVDEQEYVQVKDFPYRYDKMIITWDSKDSDKSGQAECKLKDKGDKAPVFCSFDISELKYRCAVDYGQENYIRFFSTPTLDKGVYKLGDRIRARVQLSQRQPTKESSEFNQYTKYLKMTLKNSKGAVIDENAANTIYNFNGNGMHDVELLYDHVITENDFGKKGQTITMTLTNSKIMLTKRNPASVDYDQRTIVIEDGKIKSIVDKTDGEETTLNADDLSLVSLDKQSENYVLMIEGNKGGRVTFKTGLAPEDIDTTVVITDKSAGSSTCPSRDTWTLNFDFYDSAVTEGEASTQRTIYDGKPVRESVSVPVQCREEIETMPPCNIGGQVNYPQCSCGTSICTRGQWCGRNKTGEIYCDDTKHDNEYETPPDTLVVKDPVIVLSAADDKWLAEGGRRDNSTPVGNKRFKISFEIKGDVAEKDLELYSGGVKQTLTKSGETWESNAFQFDSEKVKIFDLKYKGNKVWAYTVKKE